MRLNLIALCFMALLLASQDSLAASWPLSSSKSYTAIQTQSRTRRGKASQTRPATSLNSQGIDRRLMLIVRVSVDRKINLNGENEGTLDDLSVLGKRLEKIFDERTKAIVLRPDNLEIEKTVYVVVPSYLKKDEASKLVKEVKDAGANPATTFTEEEFARFIASLSPLPPLSGGVLNYKAINLPKPDYPSAAKAAKVQGAVTIEVIVDESGMVISARAVGGPLPLRSVATNAARQAKFNPPKDEVGLPVKIRGVLVYNFHPEKTASTTTATTTKDSPSSEDEKYRLFYAAAKIGDTQLQKDIARKIGIIDAGGAPTSYYDTFINGAYAWATRDYAWVKEHEDPAKAREYLMTHK